MASPRSGSSGSKPGRPSVLWMRARDVLDREVLGDVLGGRPDMRIAYMSTDEVNQAMATLMARKLGAVVCCLNPQDRPPDGQYDAVLSNLDDVPRHRRRDIL